MPPSPTRKFAPTPIETTTRSSKQQDKPSTDEAQATKRRRFVPEPIEISSSSSKDRRPNTPETGDLHQLKPKRFAPEPVETTKRSSRDKKDEAQNGEKPKPRRFAPEPVETTHISSKDRKESGKPHIKFTPQLLETQHGGNRGSSNYGSNPTIVEPVQQQPARKFTPMLIDTAMRSRRSGDSTIALTTTDKTEQGHNIHAREHRRHITRTKTTDDEGLDPDEEGGPLNHSELQPTDMRRPVSLDSSSRASSRGKQRTHSFRCPELDTIESSESDRGSRSSSASSNPPQGSPITASDSSFNEFKHATRIRESIDENFSQYFLQLEAKRAEKRLREQALAAFPNSDFHEPVQHYINSDKDSDSDISVEDRPVTYDFHEDEYLVNMVRRESTKVPWEQLEMQRHAERLDQERRANQVTAPQPSSGPWWNPAFNAVQPDNELRSMRDRARPPMLGGELRFPRCRSPDPARFDVTQGSTALREQMCYLTEHAEAEARKSAAGAPATLWSRLPKPSVNAKDGKKSAPPKGLWGGLCAPPKQASKPGLTVPSHPTGLVTPRQESPNPFESSFAVTHPAEITPTLQTPPAVPANGKTAEPTSIDGVLGSDHELDQLMETDYPDSFITQVYNYLSLGYPSLARPFDEELSKISRVSMADLRQDDKKAKTTPKGYIRLGSDFEGGGGVVREENCMRWVALKSYIREWARQEKDMVNKDVPSSNWGFTARKGSWAG